MPGANVVNASPFGSTLARGAIALTLLGLLIYAPALRGPFFWDDEELVYQNPDVVTRGGIIHAWFNTRASEYTPIATASYWFEWGLWHDRTLGYHVDNVLLHVANAILLWVLLGRLEIRGAFVASVLFLVHPIAVESVAWIAERRNVLSTAFLLASLIRFNEYHRTRTMRTYVGAVGLFVGALLTKAVVVVVPVVLLLILWWIKGRVDRRDLRDAVPFAVLAAIAGAVRIWFELHRAMGTVDLSRVTWSTRLSNAAAAVWFYIGKLIWPTNLTLIYPRLAPSPWTASLGTASIVLVIAMLIWRRGRWGRGPLAGTTCVLAALLPSLGLIDMSYLQHADVADHFAYLSLLAAAPLVGAWIGRHPRVCWAPALMAIVALSGLTASRAWYFGHPDELWRLSALQNPQAWTAHEHVALALFDQKDIAGAAAEFRRSLEIHPANYRAWFNLGTMLDLQRDCAGAVEAYVRARALKPGLGVAQKRIDACRERSPAPGS